MSNSIITDEGKKGLIYRAYTDNSDLSSTEYLPPSQFKIGDHANVNILNTELDLSFPISNGDVNDDGTNTLTGSSGGNNSTNNTVRYKPGAGTTDNTAQNLNVNDTSADKIFTIADLSTAGVAIDKTKYCGLWLYFRNDSLDELTTIDSVEIRLGSDSSNYYYKKFDKSDLSDGWNWLYLGIVEDLTETGTVGASIIYFYIKLTTNNATDIWAEADVVYDLLRQWEESDTLKDYMAGYPEKDLDNKQAIMKSYLNTLEAVGFNITAIAHFNKDTNKKLTSISNFTAESKGDTDEFIFIDVDRVI